MGDTPSTPSALDAGTVRSQVIEGVATVRFGHPEQLVARGVADAVGCGDHEGWSRSHVRVVVLRSEGTGAFCAGASFDEFKAVTTAEDGKKFFSGFSQVILAMIRCPCFVVTRVHGKTAGGGIGLVAASDYALAVPEAALKLSEWRHRHRPLRGGTGHREEDRPRGLLRPRGRCPLAQRRVGAQTAGLYGASGHDSRARFPVESLPRKLAGYNPEAVHRLKETFWTGDGRLGPAARESRRRRSDAGAFGIHQEGDRRNLM